MFRRALAVAPLVLVSTLSVPAFATVVTIPASKDNTLYESVTGDVSNGAGEHLFTGRTRDGFMRRAVLRFDVGAAIPAGSVVNSVTLQLTVTRVATNTLRATTLHRLTADWGEGASNAGQNEGQGAPSAPGDATWIHAFYPGTLWLTSGGDFDPTAHATTLLSGNGAYTWSGAALVADVQAWVDSPASNFGWMVKGDESVAETSKRIDSRESGTTSARPALTVDYTAGGGGATGACCLPSGDCSVLTQTQCASLGGVYQGNNSPCTPNPCAAPVTQVLVADRDNTLYQTAAGTLSNGAGPTMLTSKNAGGSLRRSLVRFDVTGIPAGSTVQSAKLTLYNDQATNSATVNVHRVTESWGEGTSVATGNGDAGAAPTTGDATWVHRFYPSTSWSTAGGSYNATASASTAVVGAGAYAFTGAGLAADVQAWLAAPAANAGWIAIGKESGAGNALKAFGTRENADTSHRPKLEVTYLPPPLGACCMPSGACSITGESACASAGGTWQGEGTTCTPNPCPLVLAPYVDPLPIVPVAQPVTGTVGSEATYVIPIREVTQKLHRDLPPTRVWGYGGTWPGPTIVATQGHPIRVTWQNDLRDSLGNLRTTHFLPVDLCPSGPDTEGNAPRVVVHLHGGHVPPAADGYPRNTILPGQEATVDYPVNQPAGTLWYHDHAMGITRLNVMMGLAGFFLVRDPVEQGLGLPAGPFEIGMAIQDRSVHADGTLEYPAGWMDHFFGDKLLVNGKIWPYLQVLQGKYRFHLLNGCNSRVLHLALSNGATFQVIGTELGLLAAPVPKTSLLIAPGERVQVVMDFAAYAPGTRIVLTNDAPAPYPGDPGVGVIPNVMAFDVVAGAGHTAALPAALRPVDPIPTGEASVTRTLALRKSADACTGNAWLIDDRRFDDITESPVLGSTEIWRFVNESGVTHPMHMHLVAFQVLDRQPFVLENGEIVTTGPPVPPDPSEAGWKDTAPVDPGEILRVIARFEDYTGLYPYHCHVLEHEDNEMMRQFQVVPPVGVEPSAAGPVTFAGNRPNPFAGQTTFEFALPRAGDVKLTAYDAAGRRVRALLFGHRPAGVHRVTWDGRDELGRPVGSGVYLVRLEAGDVTLVRKTLRLSPAP